MDYSIPNYNFYVKIKNNTYGLNINNRQTLGIEALDSNNNVIDNKVFFIRRGDNSVIAESISPNPDGTYTVSYNTTVFICDAQGNIIENLGHSG